MDSGHRTFRLVTGGTIAAGAAGAVFVFGDIQSPVRAPVVLFFLAAAPAIAVASLLRQLDAWARAIIAGTAAIVLNLGIATAMLLSGNWSVRAGYAALALISGVIATCGLAAGRAPETSGGLDRPVAE